MGSSISSSEHFNNKDTVLENYNNLKTFVGSNYTDSSWYDILADDFTENDENKVGYLTREQLDNTLEEYFQLKDVTPTTELKDDYFQKINTDGSGQVTLDQLYNFAKSAVETDFLPEFEKQAEAHNAVVWAI